MCLEQWKCICVAFTPHNNGDPPARKQRIMRERERICKLETPKQAAEFAARSNPSMPWFR